MRTWPVNLTLFSCVRFRHYSHLYWPFFLLRQDGWIGIRVFRREIAVRLPGPLRGES